MIIISNPTSIPNEIETIHTLFEEGMELLHVRKPAFSEREMQIFLSLIGPEHRSKLVLHSHLHLAFEFEINRIHFTEKNRNSISKLHLRYKKSFEYSFSDFKNDGFTVSTSTHSIKEFNTLDSSFEYAFLSPLFPSISKDDYRPKSNLLEEIKKRTNFDTKLIALGGIQFDTIAKVVNHGFDDYALLGAIWNNTNALKNFKKCQQIVHSY